ncbi:MAG: acyl-ACP--UDP-N-acetylglucosamine O-acyltransferase [Pseudomonadota bacterium]
MSIHPTAIIDDNAELADDVTVGPYTIIEDGVSVGPGTRIDSCVRLYRGTTIGRDNRIDHGVVLGCDPQDMGFDTSIETGLVIGDGNAFREGVNLSRASVAGESTRVGSHNLFMAGTHAGHDCRIGDHNVFTQGAVSAGHVTIGNRVFIGGMSAIHQFCRLGDYAMIGGLSKITRDVPPFTTIDGNPSRIAGLNVIGLRRNGFDGARRQAIKRAARQLFFEDHTLKTGLAAVEADIELAEQADVRQLLDFLHASERGITGSGD